METFIVLGILALLAVIIMTSFISFNRAHALDKDVELVVAILNDARSKTLVSYNASQYGVSFASSTVTLYTGGTYSSSDSANVSYALNTEDVISAVNLTNSATTVAFFRLTGQASETGTVTISSRRDPTLTKTITIYSTGLVESN